MARPLCVKCVFENKLTELTELIYCPEHDTKRFLENYLLMLKRDTELMRDNKRSMRLSAQEDAAEQAYLARKKREAHEKAAREGVWLMMAEREAEREYEAREMEDARRCDFGIIDCCCGGCIGEGCDFCAKEEERKRLQAGCAAENAFDISAVEYDEEAEYYQQLHGF